MLIDDFYFALEHNLKQSIIDVTEKNSKIEDQLDIIQCLKNAFRNTVYHVLKKMVLEHSKFLTGIITKMDPKEMQLGKMHTKYLSTQTNFTRNINSVRFKWGRMFQISDKMFCLHHTGSG